MSSLMRCWTQRHRPDRATSLRAWADRRGRARTPGRSAVPPARARATLGGRTGARLRPIAGGDAGQARRRGADRGGASRACPLRADAGERDLVARLFNYLVTPSGSKIAHAVDDLARYADEDPATLEPVLAVLDAARIVRRVPGRAGGPTRYEIFHDVLAPAVVAWRTSYEADQALARERAAAKRRHRRVAAVAVVALVLLAGTSALAVWALSQRSEAREKALAADAGALSAKARELEANAILQSAAIPVGLALARTRRDSRPRQRQRTCCGALCASRGSARSPDSIRP